MKKIKMAALAVCMAAVLFGCGEAQSAYEEGMSLAEEGNYEEALTSFQEAVEQNKDKTEYYIGYGLALNHLGCYEEALETFQTALKDTDNKISKENNKQLYYGMAMAEYGLGEYESTAEYCKKALEIAYFSELDDDILYTEAAALELLGEWEQAEEECQALIEQNEKYMDGYMEMAKIERQLGNGEAVKQAYQDAIAADKEYYDAYFGLYEQYSLEGDTEQANEILEQLVSIRSNTAGNLLVIGRAYYCQGNYDKAREYLDMAYDANSKESLYYSGLVEMAEESWQTAVSDFEKYLEESEEPEIIEVYAGMAQAYCELEEYDKAQEAVTEGLSYGNSSAVQALRRNQIILYEKQNQYKKARKAAKEYIRLYPEDTGMQKELSFIRTRIKK